jgi:hypothetical protein
MKHNNWTIIENLKITEAYKINDKPLSDEYQQKCYHSMIQRLAFLHANTTLNNLKKAILYDLEDETRAMIEERSSDIQQRRSGKSTTEVLTQII